MWAWEDQRLRGWSVPPNAAGWLFVTSSGRHSLGAVGGSREGDGWHRDSGAGQCAALTTVLLILSLLGQLAVHTQQ